jgi:phosphatidate cytidylyltransferase
MVIVLPGLLPYHIGEFLIILVFGMGTLMELIDLTRRAGRPVNQPVAMVGFAVLLLGVMIFKPVILPPFAILTICFAGIMIACLLLSPIGSFSDIAPPTLATAMIVGIPMSVAVLLTHEYHLALCVWVVAIAKFGDVGALLFGMWLGKHHMAPALSPKKTWEGMAGGVFTSILVSVAYAYFFRNYLPEGLTLVHAGLMAFPIVIAGVLADLAESAYKREAKVKDSGNSIPGIGGFLDLTDSFLLALPVGYFLIWAFVY